jgi:uncharacterized protein (TIGR02391 family)
MPKKLKIRMANILLDPPLESFVTDDLLLSACKLSFDGGDYWNAVSHALRHWESRVRQKAKLSAEDVGTDLIKKAFHPSEGKLINPACGTDAEREGFHSLMRGVMQFHRNAKAHREGELRKIIAIQIIAYIDYLIIQLEQSRDRTAADQFF